MSNKKPNEDAENELRTETDSSLAGVDNMPETDEVEVSSLDNSSDSASEESDVPESLDDEESTELEEEPALVTVKRKTSQAPKKKATATPKRSDKEKAVKASSQKRATLIEFLKQCIAELRKVVWLTRSQLRQYFLVVLAFVLFVIAYVFLIDMVVSWGLLKLFGS